ncbi:MAG TPA: SagB/ThcOx family dehydrogenase [Symbiobacteriaceae bacterium]|nr:SagB/ThcOx family dehydrogenase [Symbiobacteriaceae bacterium]
MNLQEQLTTHAAVRLYPPRPGSQGRWLAVHLRTRRRFAVPTIGTMVLVAFMGGNRVDAAIASVRDSLDVPENSLTQVIEALVQNGLLVNCDDPEHQFAQHVAQSWGAFGWVEAADYHLATFDYLFEDYSEDGRAHDAALMRQYAASAPDTNRGKRYENAGTRLPAPRTVDALDDLTTSFRTVWEQPVEAQCLTADRLLTLMSIAFGQLRSRRVAPEGRAPLVRKTSPSGGSRHPTEGYVFVRSVEGMEPGIYHFAVGSNELARVGDMPQDKVSDWFPGLLRAPFTPQAFIILATMFQRNMYRYREPRTFRTLFMDVGHVCGTTEVAAKGLGLRSWVQHGIHDDAIEAALGIHRLTEGAVFGIAVAGREE